MLVYLPVVCNNEELFKTSVNSFESLRCLFTQAIFTSFLFFEDDTDQPLLLKFYFCFDYASGERHGPGAERGDGREEPEEEPRACSDLGEEPHARS